MCIVQYYRPVAASKTKFQHYNANISNIASFVDANLFKQRPDAKIAR